MVIPMVVLGANGESQGKGRIGGGPALRNAAHRATFVIRLSSVS
jgi:hypothetical protein